MWKSKKLVLGFIWIMMVSVVFTLQIAEAENPVIYSKEFSGEHVIRSTTVPAAIKGYDIKVTYEIWACDTAWYWWVEVPSFRVTNSDPTVSKTLYGETKTDFFTVLAGQRATVTMDSGRAWNPFTSWGFDVSFKLTYYYDEAPPNPPAPPQVIDANDGGVYSPNNELTYTRYNPVPITWTSPGDLGTTVGGYTYGPAGVKDYLIYNDTNPLSGWVAGDQYDVNLIEGIDYHIGLAARDKDNNVGNVGAFRTIMVDQTSPVDCSIQINNDTTYTNTGSVQLNLSANDNGCGVAEMRLNDGTTDTGWISYRNSYNWEFTGGDGLKTVSVAFRDYLGNETPWFDNSVTIESIPPTVVITSPTRAKVDGIVNITANASDNEGVSYVEFYIDNILAETVTELPYRYSWDTNLYGNGSTHTITVKAFDQAGNWDLDTKTVTVNTYPTITLYSGQGFDFTITTAGNQTWGDFYFLFQDGAGQFWANNFGMNGLIDVGIQDGLSEVPIPGSGYQKKGVLAVAGHTYVSRVHEGVSGYIVFKVVSVSDTQVVLAYFYSQ